MIRGTKRPLPATLTLNDAPAKRVNAELRAKIHNRFDIEVIDAATGEIKQRAQAENVICSQLWTRLFTPAAYFNYIHYGTGTGTPSASDTSLFTFLAATYPANADDVLTYDYANGICSLRRKVQLSETTAVGSTLTEVGIGYSNTASTLCTHAMLKDMNGNQISIAKTATDILNIYATVFVHYGDFLTGGIQVLPTARMSGSANLGMLLYFCGRYETGSMPSRVYMSKSRKPGAVTYSNYPYTAATTAYNVSTKTATIAATRMAVALDNRAGGIHGFRLSSGGYASLYLDASAGTWFTGSGITGEAIGTGDGSTVDFATDFDLPRAATIYVDGVAATATVDTVPLAYNNMGMYFEQVLANGLPTLHSTDETQSILEGYIYDTDSDSGSIYYNPYWAYGIVSFTRNTNPPIGVEVSDDLVSWSTITGTTVLAEHQFKKYWRISSTSTSYYVSGLTSATLTGKNIHFATAPVAGAVITADYTTATVAKDSNHVFDLTVTITLGEYSA